MADEVYAFQVTTPAGRVAAAPLITDLTMPPREVAEIEVVIPEGCNGLLGFAFGSSGETIIPSNRGGWIIGSGETLKWEIDPRFTSGAWQVQSFNTGRYPHTLYIRFMVKFLVASQVAQAPAPIPASSLSTLTPASLFDLVTPFGSDSFGV